MPSKQRWILRFLLVACLAAWVTFYQMLRLRGDLSMTLPTQMILPSLTPSHTHTATPTFTPSLTPSATSTLTPTPTFTPSQTPTLATRVLQLEGVMSGVLPTAAPTEARVRYVLLDPPQPAESPPDATAVPQPKGGWFRFESDHPQIMYQPAWDKRQVADASRGQYHRTDAAQASARFTFWGSALRLRYVVAQNMGMFEVRVNGTAIAQLDAYQPQRAFIFSPIYSLDDGWHTLEIHSTGKAADSAGYALGLDAIDVYSGERGQVALPPEHVMPAPASTARPPVRVELLSAPPTLQATPSPPAPRQTLVTVIIAYDENGNRAVDPAEGVRGISVRVVESSTNREVARGFTDDSGYVALTFVTDQPARVVVPYFGQSWEVRRGGAASAVPYTLLLTPGNQPGLIP
jgi:hypothetical protein